MGFPSRPPLQSSVWLSHCSSELSAPLFQRSTRRERIFSTRCDTQAEAQSMAIPLSYNIRNLVVRKTTTIMTAVGIALTVSVLLAVLALVAGLRSAFENTVDPLHVLVLRKGGNAELTSLVTQQSFQVIKAFPGIAKGADGQPLASLEIVSVINLQSPESPNGMNVTLRGLPTTG